jgi:hypothetical protein
MSDQPDAQLLRCFAASYRPLADTQFVARILSELEGGRRRGWSETLRSAARALGSGLANGIAAPLRLRYAGLVVVIAAAAALWSMLQGA